MKYTKKQYEIIKAMVWEFNRVHDNEKRRKLIPWYSLASSIKNDEIVKQIMTDLKVI